MIAQQDTAEVIVEGAMRALGRHGTTRLSMTDICREAKVSRGTLYRYFANREQVLDAVHLHIMSTMRAAFDKAVADTPEPELRLRVMLRAMIDAPRRFPHMNQLIEHEPASAIAFLVREFPVVVDVVTEYLMPAFENAPPIVDGSVTPRQVSELLQRLITSTFLIPSPGSDQLDERIADLWDSFMGATAAKPVRRTPRQPATVGGSRSATRRRAG